MLHYCKLNLCNFCEVRWITKVQDREGGTTCGSTARCCGTDLGVHWLEICIKTYGHRIVGLPPPSQGVRAPEAGREPATISLTLRSVLLGANHG
jgi:hypothetical protein